MNNDNTILHNQKNTMNQRRKLLLGVASAGAIATWHKPIVNSIIVPAHAQMSVCPMITIGGVLRNPLSGGATFTACQLTFDVLSGTAGTSLNVTAITTTALPTDTTFSVDALGTATNVVGPRITMQVPTVGAPSSCSGNFTVVSDVTVTVTATCDAAAGGTFSQDFNISDIVSSA